MQIVLAWVEGIAVNFDVEVAIARDSLLVLLVIEGRRGAVTEAILQCNNLLRWPYTPQHIDLALRVPALVPETLTIAIPYVNFAIVVRTFINMRFRAT